MRKASTCQCWGISCMIVGFAIILIAAFFPGILDNTVESQAKTSAQLTQANEADWVGIPGSLDIELYRIYKLFNCTNIDDVIYKGESPEYQEFGPYTYREYDNMTDITYGQIMDYNLGVEKDAANLTWNQGAEFVSAGDRFFNYHLNLVNQAGMGVWWAQNNSDPWRTFITLIYSIVNDGLGRQVIETGIFTQMRATEFKDSDQINSKFVNENPISNPAIVTALYNDPYYGLGDVDNYSDWNVLLASADPIQRLAFKTELMTYFKLTRDQVDEMESQWQNFYEVNKRILVTLPPNPKWFENDQGTAYWQWANAFTTINNNDPSVESVSLIVDTVTGYPEFSYFKSEYFDKTCNQDNFYLFADTKLWVSEQDITVNYQYLFNLTNAEGNSPDESSLFNIDTLKTFISLGQSTQNILEDEYKDLVYGENFNLADGWSDLTNKLGLADDKQTYLMWLWLDTAYKFTFERIQDGGNAQLGVMGQLGAQAFQLGINTMQLEFPNMIYAELMVKTLGGRRYDCLETYEIVFNFTPEDAASMCSSTDFDFRDQFGTCYNLINLYYYNSTFPVDNYAMVYDLTGWSSAQFSQYIFSDSSALSILIVAIVEDVYIHYNSLGLCDSTITLQCANSNLTYNQWAYGTILKNPIYEMRVVDESYQRNYAHRSQLTYTPELFYYFEKSLQADMEFSIDDVYRSFNISGLFNLVPFGNVIMGVTSETQSNVWITEGFNLYFRFVTLNGGLNGMFIRSTPKDYLNGFIDPLIATLNDLPVYLGGDQATSSFLSLNAAPTAPVDNQISFLSGTDDYLLTRQQARWLDKEYLTIQVKDYSTMTDLYMSSYNPWSEQVLLAGTDGMQFHPILEDDDILGAFVNDLSRTCYFSYDGSDLDSYPGLDMMKFYIEDSQMYNLTNNEANAIYEIYVDGTTNMTTTLQAPAFASKGHFYQINEGIKDVSVPKIVDKDGNLIEPNKEDDETWLGVERLSGVNLVARERIQLNFQVVNDEVFNFTNTNDFGIFIPLTFVERNSDFTTSQINQLYSPYFTAQNAKWPLFGVLLGIGILTVILAGLCLRKACTLRKQEKYNIPALIIKSKVNESNNLTSASQDLLTDTEISNPTFSSEIKQ